MEDCWSQGRKRSLTAVSVETHYYRHPSSSSSPAFYRYGLSLGGYTSISLTKMLHARPRVCSWREAEVSEKRTGGRGQCPKDRELTL